MSVRGIRIGCLLHGIRKSESLFLFRAIKTKMVSGQRQYNAIDVLRIESSDLR